MGASLTAPNRSQPVLNHFLLSHCSNRTQLPAISISSVSIGLPGVFRNLHAISSWVSASPGPGTSPCDQQGGWHAPQDLRVLILECLIHWHIDISYFSGQRLAKLQSLFQLSQLLPSRLWNRIVKDAETYWMVIHP